MVTWIKLLHVLAAFSFLMLHGASVSMAFRLRRESNQDRMRAMLDLSTAFFGVTYAAMALVLLAGIVGGFLGGWWGGGWIWLSLVLAVAMTVAMSVLGAAHYHRVRKAVGLSYMLGGRPQPAVEPASQADVAAALLKGRPVLLALIGGGGLALVVGLMVLKPF